MSKLPIWHNRFLNYQSALSQLEKAVGLGLENLDSLERDGLIQRFEFTLELAWKVMKDYTIYQGSAIEILGSRDATRAAFKIGLIKNADVWMKMIADRNLTSHIYKEEVSIDIAYRIKDVYLSELVELKNTLLPKSDIEEE